MAPATLGHREHLLRWLLALTDVLGALAVLAVCLARIHGAHFHTLALLPLPFVVALHKIVGLYDRDDLVMHKSTLDEVPTLFQVATMYALLLWLGDSLLFGAQLSHEQAITLWAVTFVAFTAARTGARALAAAIGGPERCLLIGGRAAATELKAKLSLPPRKHRTQLVAHIVIEPDTRNPEMDAMVADQAYLARLIERSGIHRVIIAPSLTDSEFVLGIIREVKAAGVRVSLLPRLFEVIGSAVVFDSLAGTPVLGVRRFGLSRSSRLTKRIMDIAGSSAILIAFSPLIALVALAIKLDSRGPVLFRQIRVGRDGTLFEILKFRTMHNGAEHQRDELRHRNQADGLFKIADDPRVTRVGRLLRSTSLDELPQLWNVVRGNMSLVGPRPLVREEDRQVVGAHRRRLELMPGMTGHWQILGSSRIPLGEMVKIDYLYVANWSLWSDMKILLRTLPYMVLRRGM